MRPVAYIVGGFCLGLGAGAVLAKRKQRKPAGPSVGSTDPLDWENLPGETGFDKLIAYAEIDSAIKQGRYVGALTGERNPCNLFIESDRVTRGASAPDREMLLTYKDTSEPAIMQECAARLRAKDTATLRAGVRTWYRA